MYRSMRLCKSVMSTLRGTYFWAVLASVCLAVPAGAQEARRRDKIGIAFCGGGALGLSHIGVIRWMEEHHIPIDCVTGTSSGGLVGSFYAAGMSAAEIRATLLPMNWEEALAPDTPFSVEPYRRKEDDRAIPTPIRAGLTHGISLPSGLMAGHPIGMLLSRVGAPYSEMASFDDLPTPFRCQGVDIDTSALVTFKDGSLVTALRATMAAPGFFTPLERDGKTLVDPGLLANIPTEALKEMGPDIIIAVELSTPPEKASDARSPGDVLKRTLFIANRLNDCRCLKLASIVLTSEVNDLGAADFSHLDRTIDRGYQAAEAKSAILLRLALNDEDWKAYVTQRQSRRRLTTEVPAFIEVEGAGERETKQLKERLRHIVGAPLNSVALEKELTAITGEGRYSSMLYEWMSRDGVRGLRVVPQKRQNGPSFLKFGVAVNGADPDNIHFNTMARILALDAGAPGAEIRANMRLGTDRDIEVEYYRSVSNSRIFLAPRLFYTDDTQSIFAQGRRTSIYGTRTVGAALEMGYRTTRVSELRAGYQINVLQSSVRTGSPLLPALSGGVSMLSLRWAHDGQDSENIPTRGTRLSVEGAWYLSDPGAPKAFPKIDLRLSSFHPMDRLNSLFMMGDIGSTLGGKAGPLEQFAVGGPMLLGAYGPEEYRGNAYGYASAGAIHQIGRLAPYVGGKVLLFSSVEMGGAFSDFNHARYRGDISAGIVAETLLGPITVGGSLGEGGRKRFYFALGHLF